MENREEKILNSLAGLQKASAPDYFYTRLIGRMQREDEPVKKPVLVLRPVFLSSVLAIFLIINVFFLVQWNKPVARPDFVKKDQPATIESFAKAYNLETETVYE